MEFDEAILAEPRYYVVGRVREALAERIGDLDIDLAFVGDTITVGGTVFSDEQRNEVERLLQEMLPGTPIRNETVLPKVADPLPETLT